MKNWTELHNKCVCISHLLSKTEILTTHCVEVGVVKEKLNVLVSHDEGEAHGHTRWQK